MSLSYCARAHAREPSSKLTNWVVVDVVVDVLLLPVFIRYEKEGFQRQVAANFKALMAKDHVVAAAAECPPNGPTPWHVVDAARTVHN